MATTYATTLLSGERIERGGEPDDEAIAHVAGEQHGVVGRRQLLQLGVGRRAIEHRRAQGRLRNVYPGVYAVGHDARTFRARLSAALLSVGPDSVAGELSATALRGITPEPKGTVCVLAPAPRRRRHGVFIRRARVCLEEIEVVDGIPATTVARTLLDLAASGVEGLPRILREAEFNGLVADADIGEVLDRHPFAAGRQRLARLAGLEGRREARTRSSIEDRFLRFCVQHGLPLPEVNTVLLIEGKRFEVDFFWREAGLVVELDDRSSHGGTVAFELDRARDRALIAAGLTPMRVTTGQLRDDPARLASEIRAVLASRRIDFVASLRGGREADHAMGG
ncbi:MAG TPA: type IV toxin-antitoxin system AbiEi family antitoxin domain-containing protein [Solirubrobacterales bacterium]